MKILVVPDSFKGSLSSLRFCEIAAEVLPRRLPGCSLVTMPMADGGEGTAECLVHGTGGELVACRVTGPMSETVEARYGLLGDGRIAVVEMAQASGLPLVPEGRRDPLVATSRGTGELIVHALEQGVERIILGLGGSATNDAGVGALEALGFRFLDAGGRELGPGGAGLAELAKIETGGAHPRLDACELLIASDVTNPLLGERGATRTYGPQKGADEAALAILERALEHFAELSVQALGRDHRETRGAGAAGGMGFGFLSYLGAGLRSGFEVVAEAYGLERILRQGEVDLLITGEGAINFQTAQGKLVGRIAALGKRHGVPVIALAGAVEGDVAELYDAGITSMSSIVDRPMSLEQAMARTETLLEHKLADLGSLLVALTGRP